MAIRTVSNASQLNAAIRSANSGDTIKLKAGNYGQLNIANSSKVLTIESESAWSQATFKGIQVQKSSNLTFDNLDFEGTVRGGWGTGTGFKAWESRNIKIEDSDFQDYFKAIEISRSQGVTVSRNEFTRQSEDAMAFSGINGLQVIGNEVKGMKAPTQAHHDMIQVHTASGSSSNVVIRGNVLDSNDLQTYGITFFGGARHQNVTIDNNKVIAGHHHGITVQNAAGLNITNNVVLKDPNNNSFRDIDTPEINVGAASSGVRVSGNTTYDINGAGAAGNRIVSESVKFTGSTAPSGGGSSSSGGSNSAPDPTPPSSGGGDGDMFRFNGSDVRGWTKAVAKNVDFAAGDEIQLSGYDWGTFKQQPGGNWLEVSGNGRTATLDSRADVKELISASSDVSAAQWNETLALRIAQDDGVHSIVLQHIGDPGYFI